MDPSSPSSRREQLAVLALALIWGLGPALPALLRGELLGHPYTDLYPAVWGLHWFASHQPGLPLFAPELCWPEGTGFYYSSPLHGWLATPLLAVLSLPATWNLLVLASRVATVGITWRWLRAEGLSGAPVLAGIAVYACAPMFHGYAVEGIIEGTGAWTLPLWGWCVARRRTGWATLAFLLTVASSWYLGFAAGLVALVRLPEHRSVGLSALGGTLLSLPLWWAFSHAMPGGEPLDPHIRAAMGTPLRIPRPGWTGGLNPFAHTGYVGWLATGLFAWGSRRHPRLAAGAVLCWLLSLGRGPWHALPVLESLRFPYRILAASLFLAAPVVGAAVARLRHPAPWGPLLVAEALLLSPVEPLLPGSPPEIPVLYDEVEPTVLLEIPGPVAMPPGEINRSRPRARYLLYAQTHHGAATPWNPDFNGMARECGLSRVRRLALLDPLVHPELDPERVHSTLDRTFFEELSRAGIRQIMVHPREVGTERVEALEAALLEAGARRIPGREPRREEDPRLFRLPISGFDPPLLPRGAAPAGSTTRN